ncbi:MULTISPECIES: TetR/AcrR family transcriptional regulator [unclassified Paenibacillus]|uniref:TetR/AcrR family transcriptional regulator n=1 Tax=unclassified Paenibacillus TaxID=185978 RepID=UPI003692EBD8
MPKIVNHDERRRLLAEAAWRIIRREGLEAVSVRNVAKESGMSLGSLRHYFVTQDELLAFSMRLVSERAGERIRSMTFSGDPRCNAELLIGELLPLDEERRAEAEVWLAFVGGSVAASARELKLKVHNELYECFRGLVHYLSEHNLLKKGVDLELESKRLHAMVDGLVVHHILHPEELTPEEMMRLVTYHLDTLLV